MSAGTRPGFPPQDRPSTLLAIGQAGSPHTIYESVIRAGELSQRAPAGPTYLSVSTETLMDEWVPPAKQRQLAKVARYYIHAKGAHDRPCRFDVLAVLARDGDRPIVQHFPEAFAPAR